MTKLNYTEKEVLFMTPRKYFLMFDQYLIANGQKKEGNTYAIDELF